MTDDDRSGPADSARELAARRGLEPHVYQPAEDSALLATAAAEELADRGAPLVVLEVGTGSGWVAEKVAEATGARVVGSDLNPHACRQARERGVEAARANLLDPFRDGAFDAVLFNPPYLPTEPDNEWDDWMEQALSGGETGRELVEPFLDDLGRVLRPDGEGYLLVSSLTGYDEVVSHAADRGLVAEVARRESYPFETLSVLRLVRE